MSILECLAAAAESTMEVIVIQQSHELIAFRCNNNDNNNNNNNNIIIKDTMLSHIPSNNFNEWHDPHVLITKIHKYSSSIQCLYRPIQMFVCAQVVLGLFCCSSQRITAQRQLLRLLKGMTGATLIG